MNQDQARANIRESRLRGAAAMLAFAKILPRDELVAAVVRARTHDDQGAWDDVINSTSRLAYSKAQKYYLQWASHLSPSASFDDVFVAGLEGVHHAAMRFDEGYRFAFTTYADAWIRSFVQRSIYSVLGMGHIPETAIGAGLAGDHPLLANSALSFDHRGTDRGDQLGDTLVDDAADMERQAIDVRLVTQILEVIAAVDPRLPQIVELVQRDYSYQEIGRIVGISGDRVMQLRVKAERAVADSGLADAYR